MPTSWRIRAGFVASQQTRNWNRCAAFNVSKSL